MENRIAIPLENGILCEHFGHCEVFYIADVINGEVANETHIVPPEHEPGLYPAWVSEQGVTLVIAGGMGEKAKILFKKENVDLLVGATKKEPRQLVEDFIKGELVIGQNSCNHK